MPLGTELGPGDIVLDGDPAPPTKGGGHSTPTFRPTSIVAKRSPISATAELLFYTVTRGFAPRLVYRLIALHALSHSSSFFHSPHFASAE